MNARKQQQMSKRLEAMLDVLDELHEAASEGAMSELAGMSERELASVLREVQYLAAEALKELQSRKTTALPPMRVVEKVSKVS